MFETLRRCVRVQRTKPQYAQEKEKETVRNQQKKELILLGRRDREDRCDALIHTYTHTRTRTHAYAHLHIHKATVTHIHTREDKRTAVSVARSTLVPSGDRVRACA